MADAPSRRCSLGTAGCSSRHPAEGSPSFDADGNRAQDAPTRRNEAKRRAEVKRVQKKSHHSEERSEEVQPKSRALKKRESEPARVRLLIPRVCKYLDHKGLVGGATLAHWSEEKGA